MCDPTNVNVFRAISQKNAPFSLTAQRQWDGLVAHARKLADAKVE
jgi:hypothetical protein